MDLGVDAPTPSAGSLTFPAAPPTAKGQPHSASAVRQPLTVDLAANKVLAAGGRREPRDIVDVVTIHDEILPIGAVIWAAVEKAVGFTPEGLINEIKRNAHYTAADFQRVASTPPVDAAAIMRRLRSILEEAEAFVMRMPTDKLGLLFLKDGKIVQPDPDHLENYTTHAGKRQGHWPSSSEIGSAMLDKYR